MAIDLDLLYLYNFNRIMLNKKLVLGLGGASLALLAAN